MFYNTSPQKIDRPPPVYTVSVMESPKRINARSLKSNDIKLEWIPYTRANAITYAIVAIISLIYNGTCFVHNFGRMPLQKVGILDDMFGEEALLYTVVMQWILIFAIFAVGIALERSIPQPMHIFLSMLATYGNMVLFAINVRKVYDGIIKADAEYFIFITLLFHLSTALCVCYIVALSYYMKQKRLYCSDILSSTALHARKRKEKEHLMAEYSIPLEITGLL
ncbi:hypothetical protein RB195_020896 [Necator americanus]|uniref:Uncharacterized protein n=1 Tax=Necator americanus TaxID=51031 RepID=A0ABR1CL79_NECAM